MRASTINAEIFQQLSYIADDESAMEKALKAIKRIAAQKSKTEKTEVSKEELVAELREAFGEVKACREGRLKLKPVEELFNED